MNVENWSSYYKKGSGKHKLDEELRTTSLWLAIGLLWLAFFSITEKWMWPCELQWGFIIPWLVMLWAVYEIVIPHFAKFRLLKWLMPLAVILAMVLVVAFRFRDFCEGLYYILMRYLQFFDAYYYTGLSVSGVAGRYSASFALTCVVMLLWLGFWCWSYARKKPMVLAWFGITALFFTMLVGVAPGKLGVLALFFAIMLMKGYRVEGLMARWVIPVLLAGSVLITTCFFDGSVERLIGKVDELIAWEQGLDFERIDLSNFAFDFYAGQEELNNRKPDGMGREVFEIWTTEKPRTSLYLRGFYGTEYADGVWSPEDAVFLQACEDAGYDEAEAAKMVSGLTVELLLQSTTMGLQEYDIAYVGGVGDVAYVPYQFLWDTMDQEYEFSGDYLIKKGSVDTKMELLALSQGDMLSDPSIYTHLADDVESMEFRAWYNQVAAHYLQVPEDVGGIREAVEVIETYVTDANDRYGVITDNPTLQDALVTNYHRNELVNLVRAYLGELLTYSLSLDELPQGVDAIEYALLQGHKGYCMHYASAATLILRELGVPARYASGYVVKPREFKSVSEEDKDGAMATVTDHAAHAWVEVYYEYIGWVPIEVTGVYNNGSGMGPFPTLEELQMQEEDPGNTDDPTEQPEEPVEDPENPDGSQEDPNEPQEDPEGPNAPIEDPEEPQESQDEPTEEPDEGNEPQSPEKENEAWWLPITILFAFLLTAGVIGACVYSGKKRKQKLGQALAAKDYRKAVRRMNRAIYCRLLLKRGLWGERARLTDAEYEMALKEVFSSIDAKEWEAYMEVAKKMYYSQEEISEEEMKLCYKCYTNPDMRMFKRRK